MCSNVLVLETSFRLSGTCFVFQATKYLTAIVNARYGVRIPSVSYGEPFTALRILCALPARYDSLLMVLIGDEPLPFSFDYLCSSRLSDPSFGDSCDPHERDNSCGKSQQSVLAQRDAHYDEIKGISEKQL